MGVRHSWSVAGARGQHLQTGSAVDRSITGDNGVQQHPGGGNTQPQPTKLHHLRSELGGELCKLAASRLGGTSLRNP